MKVYQQSIGQRSGFGGGRLRDGAFVIPIVFHRVIPGVIPIAGPDFAVITGNIASLALARVEAAFVAALPLLSKQFQRRAVIDGTDARIAAAKGLIAAGVESPEDVSAITRTFRERGVKQGGDDTALVWGVHDRFGNPVRPKEWFLVPLPVIDEVVSKIRDGSIVEFKYDPQSARLVAVK